jgi:hypothetical protein
VDEDDALQHGPASVLHLTEPDNGHADPGDDGASDESVNRG